MTEIFRIRSRFEQLWKEENKRLDVTVTSAVELDPAVVEKVGAEVERQTGQKVELASRSTARSSAGSSCRSATWFSTPAFAVGPGETSKASVAQAA